MQALHSNSGSTASIERCMPAQINCRELLSDDSKSDEHGGAARRGCSPFLSGRDSASSVSWRATTFWRPLLVLISKEFSTVSK